MFGRSSIPRRTARCSTLKLSKLRSSSSRVAPVSGQSVKLRFTFFRPFRTIWNLRLPFGKQSPGTQLLPPALTRLIDFVPIDRRYSPIHNLNDRNPSWVAGPVVGRSVYNEGIAKPFTPRSLAVYVAGNAYQRAGVRFQKLTQWTAPDVASPEPHGKIQHTVRRSVRQDD